MCALCIVKCIYSLVAESSSRDYGAMFVGKDTALTVRPSPRSINVCCACGMLKYQERYLQCIWASITFRKKSQLFCSLHASKNCEKLCLTQKCKHYMLTHLLNWPKKWHCDHITASKTDSYHLILPVKLYNLATKSGAPFATLNY